MKVVLDTNVLLVAIPFHTPYYPNFQVFSQQQIFHLRHNRHFAVLKTIEFPSIRVLSAEDFVEMLTGNRPVL